MSKRLQTSNNSTSGGQFTPETLKAARLALKISQCDLSRKSGVLAVQISNFELGGRVLNANEQRLIRKALNVEAARLMTTVSEYNSAAAGWDQLEA